MSSQIILVLIATVCFTDCIASKSATGSLGQPCTFDESHSFKCLGINVEPVCDKDTHKCECRKGFAPITKYTSYCTPIQRYPNDKCNNDAECHIAFTSCVNGRCLCADGFDMKAGYSGRCIPKSYRCPVGEPLKAKADQVLTCTEVHDPKNPNLLLSTCPSGYNCFYYVQTNNTKGVPMGHCCPALAKNLPVPEVKVCPTGVALNATCSANSKPGQLQCPTASHKCISPTQRLEDHACCPLPCRGYSGRFAVSDKCYERIGDDIVCQLDIQCLKPNTSCKFSPIYSFKTCL